MAHSPTTCLRQTPPATSTTMMKAGVRIYEKTGGTLHAKTATFDREFSIVGSST